MNFFFIIHNKLSIIVLVHLKSNNMGNLSYSICSALIYGGFLPKCKDIIFSSFKTVSESKSPD